MNEIKLDKVVLWVNDTPEDARAAELLRQVGVEFTVQHVNIDSRFAPIETPSLQTLSCRYSGVSLIESLTREPDYPILDVVKSDTSLYRTRVKLEEVGIKVQWPEWSERAINATLT